VEGYYGISRRTQVLVRASHTYPVPHDDPAQQRSLA
jgi:hypothetical protein